MAIHLSSCEQWSDWGGAGTVENQRAHAPRGTAPVECCHAGSRPIVATRVIFFFNQKFYVKSFNLKKALLLFLFFIFF